MLPQIVFMCKQLLALLPRYAWKNMVEIPGRKPLSRHLTSAYKAVAERTFEVKNTRIAKGKERSDKEWDDFALKVGMAMLSMQLVPEAVRALGPRRRRMAVALETKVVGQLSRRAAFWTSLTTKTTFYAEVKALLPLIASHLNKSKTPLQIAAFWIVPRPATHMWVPVGKGAARQRVTEHLVESWMLASIPPRKCHCLCCRRSKSGPLQAPGHDKKKQARVPSSVLLFKRSWWVLKEVLRLE
jgi:hypothetical protein